LILIYLEKAAMNNDHAPKHPLRSIALTLAVSAGLSAPTLANHKTNVPPIDFATNGANYPGWTTLAECEGDRPGQGCRVVMNDCSSANVVIYSTQRIFDALKAAVSEGQELPVHSVTTTGHFIERLCTAG